MRFPTKFVRQFGAASSDPLVGSDLDPATGVALLADCQGSYLLADNVGWPIQRIVMGMAMSAGTPAAVTVNVWIYDEASFLWFIAATKTVTPGVVAASKAYGGALQWFDMPILADPPQLKGNALQGGKQGALGVYYQLKNTGLGAPQNAVYTVVAGPDKSNTV